MHGGRPILDDRICIARDTLESEAMSPGLLLQVHEHLLLQLVFPICDSYAVVMPAFSMLTIQAIRRTVCQLGAQLLPA